MPWQRGWAFRLEVFPNGRHGHAGFVSAYIRVRPPSSANSDWSRQVTCRFCACCKLDKIRFSQFSLLFDKEGCCKGRCKFLSHDQIRKPGRLTPDGKLRILAEIGEVALPVAMQPALAECSVELLAAKPEFVSFHLHDGSTLHFDKRLLIARSSHFANMLSGATWLESQTNEIPGCSVVFVFPFSVLGSLEP